jgi:hypothetical protein
MWNYISALLFMLPPLLSLAEESGSPNKVTLYLRETVHEYSPNLLTLNGLYDYQAPWMTLQFGARVGESQGKLGAWSYKLELTSQNLLDHYRASVRLVKNDGYVPRSSSNTMIVEKFAGSFKPFEDFELLNKLSIDTETGLAETFSSTTGSTVLPSTNGPEKLIPLFALRLNYHANAIHEIYSFTFSNFDVFDPYPTSQPFFQIEINQKLDNYNVLGYVRYRWDNSISQLYALYIALGLETPE